MTEHTTHTTHTRAHVSCVSRLGKKVAESGEIGSDLHSNVGFLHGFLPSTRYIFICSRTRKRNNKEPRWPTYSPAHTRTTKSRSRVDSLGAKPVLCSADEMPSKPTRRALIVTQAAPRWAER